MARFQDTWSRPQTPGIGERLGEAVRPKGALKPRVQAAISRLQKQSARLDTMLARLADRDAKLFERVVAATQQHDDHSKRVLSSELAEVRKVKRVLGNARMSLEQIEMRLSTCSDLGDTVMAIMPTVGLMNGMRSSLARFMPGADQEISRMSEMLGGMMTETFSGEATFGADPAASEESEKILQEAAAVAESSAGTKLPSTPMDLGAQQPEDSPARFM